MSRTVRLLDHYPTGDIPDFRSFPIDDDPSSLYYAMHHGRLVEGIHIDEQIGDTVIALTRRGYVTLHSCSGGPANNEAFHLYAKYADPQGKRYGYVMIEDACYRGPVLRAIVDTLLRHQLNVILYDQDKLLHEKVVDASGAWASVECVPWNGVARVVVRWEPEHGQQVQAALRDICRYGE